MGLLGTSPGSQEVTRHVDSRISLWLHCVDFFQAVFIPWNWLARLSFLYNICFILALPPFEAKLNFRYSTNFMCYVRFWQKFKYNLFPKIRFGITWLKVSQNRNQNFEKWGIIIYPSVGKYCFPNRDSSRYFSAHARYERVLK